MENIHVTLDQYGDGTAIIEIYKYEFQGKFYVKAVRRVVRTGKEKTLFNLLEKTFNEIHDLLALKELDRDLSGKCLLG